MKIVIVSDFLNHHQVPVADELFKLTDGNFYFVETKQMLSGFSKLGYCDDTERTYLIQAWKDKNQYEYAMRKVLEADAVRFGGDLAIPFMRKRLELNKLSFDVSERWFKKGIINILSPKLLKRFVLYHLFWRNKPLYKLCSSAYCANDLYFLNMFKGRCYKWGYFTKVQEHIPSCISSSKILIMWCARFIDLKHPELMLYAAKKLKDAGYNFNVNMYGDGILRNEMQKLAKSLDIVDIVSFKGNVNNDIILEAMKQSSIFVFTSDQNEGWGAVANESMANGCALVTSDRIGSTPFLIEDGVNGLIFESCNVDSLTVKLKWLMEHPKEMHEIQINAYKTMVNVWSPKVAAKNILTLALDLSKGCDTTIEYGPCSKAYPV